MLGTPEYMSPEQALGEGSDRRSDIYSLGVVLYQCLVGQLPFQSETVVGTIYKIVNEPPTPPRTIRSNIPEKVERVVLRSLAKKPEERYNSCGELIEALRHDEMRQIKVSATTKPFEEQTVTGVAAGTSVQPTREWRRRFIRIVVVMSLAMIIFLFQGNHSAFDRVFSTSRKVSHADAEKIKTLLAQAQNYFDQNKLTMPAGANAFQTFKEFCQSMQAILMRN